MANINKILVAIDFSNTSKKALDYANTLTKSLEATLDVVYVFDPGIIDFGVTHFTIGGVSKWVENLDEQKEIEEKKLEDLQLENPGEKFILGGKPGKAIVEYIKNNNEYNLLIIGSHGYGKMDRFMLGSVSEYVTRNAPCAVMVVKTNE